VHLNRNRVCMRVGLHPSVTIGCVAVTWQLCTNISLESRQIQPSIGGKGVHLKFLMLCVDLLFLCDAAMAK